LPTKDISSLLTAHDRGRTAIIDGERRISFGELDDLCARIASGLMNLGVAPGDRVVLMWPPSIEFVALAFGLFRAGAVPVMIDPGIGLKWLSKCLAESEPAFFIGVPKAVWARRLLGWAPSARLLHYGALVRAGQTPRQLPPTGETAAVLFTSGSTGAPKGAVYTHEVFHAQARLLGGHFGVKAGQVSVPTFPLFALFDVGLGMTAVLPRMDYTRPGSVDPMAVIGPIQKHGAAQLFGSPALLDRVGRFGERHGIVLPSIERVLSAGAPVPAKVVARFKRMLAPSAQVHTPYGATEALPVACVEESVPGFGTCVGRPLPGVEVKILPIVDGPLASLEEVAEGQVGELAVSGPVVTRGYFRRPEADALSKIGAWHRMGDLGWRDKEGRLWFCGRKSHRLGTLYTIPCEAVFNAHPRVRRTALVGVGGKPVLCVELEPGQKADETLTRELLALGAAKEHTKGITTVLYHPSFPVDIRHNAKIFREKLAVWAEGRLS
jgi:acyl-CoA synthetase (AMP-forming)/AMP-acid ligase II